jgi:hypothetical protein
MYEPRVGDLVWVRWDDHWSAEGSSDGNDDDYCIQRTVGEVYKVSDKSVWLSSRIDETPDNDPYYLRIRIRRCCIMEIDKLVKVVIDHEKS